MVNSEYPFLKCEAGIFVVREFCAILCYNILKQSLPKVKFILDSWKLMVIFIY